MTNRPVSSTVSAPQANAVCVVRWVLRTGRAAIACEVEMRPDRTFELRVSPSWQPRATRVEHFETALSAMKRHAQVAGSLRDLGWEVTDRSAPWQLAA